jgi:hypothetical protein
VKTTGEKDIDEEKDPHNQDHPPEDGMSCFVEVQTFLKNCLSLQRSREEIL